MNIYVYIHTSICELDWAVHYIISLQRTAQKTALRAVLFNELIQINRGPKILRRCFLHWPWEKKYWRKAPSTLHPDILWMAFLCVCVCAFIWVTCGSQPTTMSAEKVIPLYRYICIHLYGDIAGGARTPKSIITEEILEIFVYMYEYVHTNTIVYTYINILNNVPTRVMRKTVRSNAT